MTLETETSQKAEGLKKCPGIKQKLLPLTLFFAVIVLDQFSKMLVVKNIPSGTIGVAVFGDFLQIIHENNLGAAFSIGSNFSSIGRLFSMCLIPLFVLLAIFVVYFVNKDFTNAQRWCITGLLGGGFGNLIDRFFRPSGVVDFIDVKFYGLFGLERWPTFNIADSAILICAFLMVIFILKDSFKESNKKEVK